MESNFKSITAVLSMLKLEFLVGTLCLKVHETSKCIIVFTGIHISKTECMCVLSGKTSEVLKPTSKEYPIDTVTHDIRDYMPLLHKQRKSEDPAHVRLDNLRTLRKLLRKL